MQGKRKPTASKKYASDDKGRVQAWGEWKHPTEWVCDPRCICSLTTLRRRLVRGMTPEAAMTGRVFRGARPMRKITAWGETKYLIDWVQDERCAVGYETAQKRLLDPSAWSSMESLLCTPPRYRTPSNVTIGDITRTALEWDRDPTCTLTAATVRQRVRAGLPLDRPHCQYPRDREKEQRVAEALDAFEAASSPLGELPLRYDIPKRLVLSKSTLLRLRPLVEEFLASASEVSAMLVTWWEGEGSAL